MRAVRILLAAALLTSGLTIGLASPALAAGQTETPNLFNNDGTHTFTVTGVTAVANESVSLTQAGSPTLQGTVTEPDAGPLCIQGVSDSGCGDSITVSVNFLNANPGLYDLVRTQTSAGIMSTTTTTTQKQAILVKSLPVVTSISPSSRGQDSSSLITISGSGFAAGATVSMGAGTTISDVTVVSASTITASVAVSASAATGTRDVTVTSAGGVAGTKSAALTIAPAPTLTAVSPNSGLRGQALTGVTFTGSGFATGGDFAISIAGVAVNNPIVSSDGSTITANLTVSQTATGGLRTVQVTNDDGGRARLLNGFKVVAAPSAPQQVNALSGDASATVIWNAPADPGSSPVTSYVVTPSVGQAVTVSSSARSAVISGLTNGSSYTFSVAAKNADVGLGPAATSGSVTPKYVSVLTALSNRGTAISGQSTIFYGYLRHSTASGAPYAATALHVVLKPAIGASVVRNVTTDVHGRWSTTYSATYTTSVTVSYAGSSSSQPTSASVSLPVSTKITVSSPAADSTSSAHSTLYVRGTTTPNKKGTAIMIYRVVNGTSALLSRSTVASNGSYALPVRLAAGNYVLQVEINATGGNTEGMSPQFIIKRR